MVSINGSPVRDVIQYQLMVDAAEVSLTVDRGGLGLDVDVTKAAGEPLGMSVESAVFDQVRTCDNHCEFCFIYQLPPGMRKSLYVKDDDYRLSFLYGNFTTLTRFTEADLERVVTERLSPLYVSIHATDPDVREDLLRNRRGGMSLRWLRALLDNGIDVHGQIVVCPGLNDGTVLDDTMCGILDEFPELRNVAVVPLGVSAHNREARMRPHTAEEAAAVIDVVESWQETFVSLLGHPMAHVADEYYLLAGRPFPPAAAYGEFDLHEDGIGMARAFELEFRGETASAIGSQPGFFSSVDGAPATGYRAPRWEAPDAVEPDDRAVAAVPVALKPKRVAADRRAVAVLTSRYGAAVIEPLVADRPDIRVIEVENRFFGGNTGVTGLMVGEDVERTLAAEPAGDRYLLPDVCLSGSRFLDGASVDELSRPVEVVPTNGIALREALGS